MTLRLGAVRLRVHLMLPFLWGLMILLGSGLTLLPTLLALTLHETGHLLAARLTGIPVEEIEITPYGGVIHAEELSAATPLRVFLVAFFGPLLSALGCLAAAALWRGGFLSLEFSKRLFQANLTLMLINLIPALPLDGGRMLRAILTRFFPYRAVSGVLGWLGRLLGALLIALSLIFALRGELNFGPAFAGCYLLYAAALEGRQSTARYVNSLISRRQRLDENKLLPVEHVVAGEKMPVRTVLLRLGTGKYHLIRVLGADGRETLGTVDEAALCDALLSDGEATLGSLLRGRR